MRKKKKYGSGTAVKGVIKDPSEVLAQNQINIAEAKYAAYSNPVHMALGTIGGILMEKGINSLAGASFGGTDIDTSEVVENNPGGWKYGKKGGKPVIGEAEGEEVVEVPGSSAVKLQGPSHEKGGIDVVLPEGTKIFSKRIKIKGKSPAERKIAREKKLKKIQDKLAENPSDIALQESLKRIKQTNKIEERADMRVQEIVSALDGLTEFAVNSKGKKKFSTGIGWGDDDYDSDEITAEPTVEPEVSGILPWTFGDVAGMFGTAVSGFGPMLNTLRSRATDTPNVNQFEGFGEDALEANLEAQNKVDAIKDNQSQDLRLKRAASIKRNRNRVRSLNTLNALDIATDTGINADMRKIYNDWANQMIQLQTNQANLEMMQDEAVFKGKAAADIANRQDKGAFDTALTADIANLGTAFQKLGSDLNQRRSDQDFLDMLPDVSMYDLGYVYEDGKLKIKKV